MKSRKSICLTSLLAVLALGLAGCSEAPAVSASSSVPASSSSSSAASSSTSVAPVPSDELTADMLAEAAAGYSSEAQIATIYDFGDGEAPTVYKQLAELQANKDFYHVKSYDQVDTSEVSEPTKDTVYEDQYYTHVDVKGTEYAAYAAIGLSNAVEATQIPILWDESFNNIFARLQPEDFQPGEEEYHFVLDVDAISATLADAILSQATGAYGFELASFEIVTDGFHITGFHAVSAVYDVYGMGMSQEVDATIVALGEEAFPALEPYAGTEDAAFQEAMESLAKGNYHVKEDIYAKGTSDLLMSTEADAAGGIFTIPDGGVDYYYVPRDGNLYEVAELTFNDGSVQYYKDGYYYYGCGDPSFAVSSVFFDKQEDGSFVLDAEGYPEVTGDLSAIDPLDSGEIEALTIDIAADSVTFNVEMASYDYVVTYSDIGAVASPDVTIPEDIDYSRLNKLFSGDVASFLGLGDLPSEDAAAIIEAIPVLLYYGIPGIYTFTDDNGGELPAIGIEVDGADMTQDEFLEWADSQFSTLVANTLADDGFAIDMYTGTYSKDVTGTNATYTIASSIVYAASETGYVAGYVIDITEA